MEGLRLLTARLLGWLATTVFVALVADVLWGVFTRYALGQQAPWSEELARLLLVWLSMLGTALAYASRSHLGVDVILISLASPARHIATVTIHLLVLGFAAGVMLYGGASLFVERLDSGQMMSALPLRKAWTYLAIPVSGAAVSVFAIDAILEQVRRGLADPSAPEAR